MIDSSEAARAAGPFEGRDEVAGSVRIRHVSIVDPASESVAEDHEIVIEDGRVRSVGPDSGQGGSDREIDGRGFYAIPGLIDCHVHAVAVVADLHALTLLDPGYVAAASSKVLEGMLARGFTTVRDMGGCGHGLATAVDQGLIRGPRVAYCGRAISQTGGHGDVRPVGHPSETVGAPGIGRIVDGRDGVLRAAREEIRLGASHIKLMLSGGCASPTDPIGNLQFSDEEVAAAVDEVNRSGRYCAGHAYTSDAVTRALRLGVRTIEHGNLIDEATARAFLECAGIYVPTLVTYKALVEEGRTVGISDVSHRKAQEVGVGGLAALELATRHDVPTAFGTDLLGPMHRHQSEEFFIRREVQSCGQILRSATSVGDTTLQTEGNLGVISAGAMGDVVLLRSNPLEDIAVLGRPSEGIAKVVKAGRVVVEN